MCDLKARELAEYDDIANSICIDPVIGFSTHKMSPRHRHSKGVDCWAEDACMGVVCVVQWSL